MNTDIDLITRDRRHVWHPCASLHEIQEHPPLVITHAEGNYLFSDKGPLIDAISSWWCKSLGHGHPAVVKAIQKQLGLFEHAITANTTHANLVKFSELMTEVTGLQYQFFASDGACAIEIAIKLALHANRIKGLSHKNDFISLKNAYHGETLGALGVSDLGLYKEPYQNTLLNCHFIDPIPYVNGPQDPLWHDASLFWQQCEPALNQLADKTAAVIVEPIIQGAAGMRFYSPDFLKRLYQWARQREIFFIADEIMTGMGRTGEWLASFHLGIQPDMVCLSKGLTNGTIPLSSVMITSEIHDLFYSGEAEHQPFLHSHTHSGNALAISAALATLQVLMQDNLVIQTKNLQQRLMQPFAEIARITGKLTNLRGIGGIVAADLTAPASEDIAKKIYNEAIQRGALLRPIGNTLYWLPPLTIDQETIDNLAEITLNSIQAIAW